MKSGGKKWHQCLNTFLSLTSVNWYTVFNFHNDFNDWIRRLFVHHVENARIVDLFPLQEKKAQNAIFFKNLSLPKPPFLPPNSPKFNHIPFSHEFPRVQKSSFSPNLETTIHPSNPKKKKETSKDPFSLSSSLNPKNKAYEIEKNKKK